MKYKAYIPQKMETLWQSELKYERYFSPNLHVTDIRHGLVLPSIENWDHYQLGGVLDQNLQFVPYSGWQQGCENTYPFDMNNVSEKDEEVVYLGTLNNCWGHALTDNFRHVWLWFSSRYKEQYLSNRKVVYVTVNNKPLTKASKDLLRLAGVNVDELVHITQLTRFKSVAVPSDCVINVNYGFLWSDEYKNIIEAIKERVNKEFMGEVYEKIYFTRSLLPNSTRDIGEHTIEKCFLKAGYKIIAPEKHSVIEQIYMVMHCSYFAATEGSVGHIAVFCEPNTEVTMLLKIPSFNPYQFMVNDLARVNVTYVDAQDSFRLPKMRQWEGPFYLCETEHLKHYFGITPPPVI